MGLRIIQPNGVRHILIPLTSLARTVQLRCNVEANEHTLEFRSSVKSTTPSGLFIIEFSVSEFAHVCKMAGTTLAAFARQVKNKKAKSYSPTPLLLDAPMLQCIYRITQYEGSADVRNMYFYAQTIELLVLMQKAYEKQHANPPVHIKNEYDKERILYARDYLLTHIDSPPTLPELAAIIGINEFKLKCGFKEMFGLPPFMYLAEVRLEMARTALRQKQKTVTQIAFELGYASLQHFSAAFKKKFGVAPARFN